MFLTTRIGISCNYQQTLKFHFGVRVLVQYARAFGTLIYYTNAHMPHTREFLAYAREHITRELSVASGPDYQSARRFSWREGPLHEHGSFLEGGGGLSVLNL